MHVQLTSGLPFQAALCKGVSPNLFCTSSLHWPLCGKRKKEEFQDKKGNVRK
jgi:hypothetical protein